MANRNEMLQLLEDERDIRENRIIAEKDGEIFVSFEDAKVINSVDAYDGAGTGYIQKNRDGSLASFGKTTHAVSTTFFFANRYRVKTYGKQKKLYVVSGHTPEGFRLIQEQPTGRCYIKTIPVYILTRDSETNELVFEKKDTISENEFISEFTKTLDNKSMAEILPLIVDKGSEITADAMPI